MLPTLVLLLVPPLHAQTLLHTLVSPNAQTDGYFGGWCVEGPGDLTGDGVPDVAVCAGDEDLPGLTDAGRAYVFDGATGAIVHTLVSPAPVAGGRFGFSMDGLGDVTGDGVPDLLVGEPWEGEGRAYVFDGASGAAVRTLTSPNPESGGAFGSGSAGLGDVTGDGVPDLAVAAYREGPTDVGRVYVFDGATGSLLHTLTSATGDWFGYDVAALGDATGDGVPDLAVGVPYEDVSGDPSAGRAYVFDGASGALVHAITSPNAMFGGQFGRSVASMGDVTGDGLADLLVGADLEIAGANNRGRAYVFDGATAALVHSFVSPTPSGPVAAQFGLAVEGVGDVTGDGVPDALVGEPNGPSDGSGRAHVFSGASGALAHTLASPSPAPDAFGYTLAGLGDLSGDGTPDFAVGALEDGGAPQAGQVYVFSGVNTVAIEGGAPGLAGAHRLSAASPNPFTARAAFTLAVARPQAVIVMLHDALGREVRRLHDGPLAASVAHPFTVDGAGLPSGAYVVRVAGEDFAEARTVVLVR